MFAERLQPTGVAKVVESFDHLTLVVSAGGIHDVRNGSVAGVFLFTSVDDEAPRCEACGCEFPRTPVTPSRNWRGVLSYGMVVALAIALGMYLRYC
jgi:hypothetical protein